MSKMYEKYLKEKENNSDLYYLFECGKFYIFLDEDARKISNITTLKLTKLNDDIVKCGFPINSLDKYMNIFNNLNLGVKVIEKEKDFDINNLIKKIKYIDIDNITPMESLNILKSLKEYINE